MTWHEATGGLVNQLNLNLNSSCVTLGTLKNLREPPFLTLDPGATQAYIPGLLRIGAYLWKGCPG